MFDNHDTTTTTRTRKVLYWVATVFTAFAFAALALANLTRAPQVMAGLTRLGYPPIVATILGMWKVLGAIAILIAGWPRLKEWAYAGMFFVLSGAAVSHAAHGDPFGNVLVPLVLLAFVMTSWGLQPARNAAVAPQRAAQPA